MKILTCFISVLTLVLANTSCRKNTINTPSEGLSTIVEHNLDIVRPGAPTTESQVFILFQCLNNKKQPDSYAMWVDSVICREEHCDVVQVKIHWDALGRYQRYEVAEGSFLTKLDHKPFTHVDSEKLQMILLDQDSPLGEVEKEAMTGKEQKGSEHSALDGVSGATILTLKNDVIIGAGYTCYDLWHIANGTVGDHIQELTGKDSSVEVLKNYLNSEDTLESAFAIESLQKRKIGNTEISKAVMVRALKGDESLVLPTMVYFKEASPNKEGYRKSLLEFFNKATSSQRVLFLGKLLPEPPKAAPEFYETLCENLGSLETFYETQLFFRLCERQKVSPEALIPQAVKLLSHPNFFVQRRAFDYLNSKQCSPEVTAVLDAYYKKNKKRL